MIEPERKVEKTVEPASVKDLNCHLQVKQEVDIGNTGISCPHDQTGNQVPM